MAQFVVTGRIHPERAPVEIRDCTWKSSDGNEIRVRCEASQLTVHLDCPDYVSAYILAEHVAHAVVAALGFSLGYGYSVEMVQVIGESGEVHVFGIGAGDLGLDPQKAVFRDAHELAKRDLRFRMALLDYGRAIRDSWGCAAHCYRAIEAIESSFGSWDTMHASLGTDRREIEGTVKSHADPIRHGNWKQIRPTNSGERAAILRVTRDVLKKYLDFKLPQLGERPPSPDSQANKDDETQR